MSLLTEILSAALLISLMLGPVGHYLVMGTLGGAPDLFVLMLWAYAWFGAPSGAVRLSIMLGVMLDLLSFGRFYQWTLILTALTAVTVFLRRRFFEAASAGQAIAALLLASLVENLALAVFNRSFELWLILRSLGLNALLGLLVFYILASRYKTFARAAGRRL